MPIEKIVIIINKKYKIQLEKQEKFYIFDFKNILIIVFYFFWKHNNSLKKCFNTIAII
jgi:hypothetical protein